MTNEERKAALEAIIYAADEPATLEQLTLALGDEKLAVQSSLDELIASYAQEEVGPVIAGLRRGPECRSGGRIERGGFFCCRCARLRERDRRDHCASECDNAFVHNPFLRLVTCLG